MRLRTMPVPLANAQVQRIGLALLTLRNISLFDVLFLVFRIAGADQTL